MSAAYYAAPAELMRRAVRTLADQSIAEVDVYVASMGGRLSNLLVRRRGDKELLFSIDRIPVRAGAHQSKVHFQRLPGTDVIMTAPAQVDHTIIETLKEYA